MANPIGMSAPARLGSESGACSTTSRPLDRLSVAADRVERLGNHIEGFLNRYHGPVPQPTSDRPEAPSCYANELTRLFEAIDRLEACAAALGEIG